jgi:hypothetical protein
VSLLLDTVTWERSTGLGLITAEHSLTGERRIVSMMISVFGLVWFICSSIQSHMYVCMYNVTVIFLLLTVFKDEFVLSFFSDEKQNFRQQTIRQYSSPHLLKAGKIYLCHKFLEE